MKYQVQIVMTILTATCQSFSSGLYYSRYPYYHQVLPGFHPYYSYPGYGFLHPMTYSGPAALEYSGPPVIERLNTVPERMFVDGRSVVGYENRHIVNMGSHTGYGRPAGYDFTLLRRPLLNTVGIEYYHSYDGWHGVYSDPGYPGLPEPLGTSSRRNMLEGFETGLEWSSESRSRPRECEPETSGPRVIKYT